MAHVLVLFFSSRFGGYKKEKCPDCDTQFRILTLNIDYTQSEQPVQFSSAYLGPGRWGSSLSKDTHISLSPATFASSSGGILRHYPGQLRDINPSSVSWVGPRGFLPGLGSILNKWLLWTWRGGGSILRPSAWLLN